MEEREEGELTDDFEEVSDCSMSPGSPLNCGKSVTAELLSDVSLSSVGSEKEYNNTRMIYERNTRRYYQRNQRLLSSRGFRRKRKMTTLSPTKTNHVKRRRRSMLHHSDHSDDDSLDPKYVKKLREALHHETPCTLLHSSLKTRLKGFIKPGSQSDDDDESELRDIALSTCAVGENENEKDMVQICNVKSDEKEAEKKTEDFELQQLRIAALRSFVLENHKKRKNKAAVTTESKEGDKADVQDDVNKENEQGVINNEEKKEPEKDEMSNGSCEVDLIEEDVDILRTMLLASMSTKLIEKKVEDTIATGDVVNPIKVDNKTQSNDKKTNNFLPNKVVVKPLIINVGGSDSDSEVDVGKKDEQTTESVVAEFLKRQRAKVEAKENEIKLKSEISTLKKNQIIRSSTNNVVKTPNNTKTPYDLLLDKSELKLLPRSQQLEYRKLKMQLLNATRKKLPLKRSSFTKRENNSPLVNLNAKKVPKFIKSDATNLDSKSGVVNGIIDFKFKPQDNKKCFNSTQDLQRTLDGLQIRRNGRLQIKGKYQSLQPLLNKINRASHERMINEKEIKILLQKLQHARNRFSQMDQHFSILVQQLVTSKSVIDQRICKLRAFNATTTKKINVVPSPLNSETIIEKVEEEKNLVESKNVDSIAVDTNLISGKNLCDPNDVVQDVPQTSVGVSSFTKYTSPLDNRCQISDPQAIMCPYDLLGVCKDKECGYLHC